MRRWRLRRPLVSVVVCTKDGMPFIREAIDSLARQTYRHFEVIVQDGTSSDGTAEFLSSLQLQRVDFRSEPDSGIGDAYNRAFARCSGDLVATLDADNLLLPDALAHAVRVSLRYPDAAAFYGSVQVVDEAARPLETFTAQPFDRAALMRCELVPPFSATFFSRRVCAGELRFDPSLRTCADFDLFLRLSDREIVRTGRLVGATRFSAKSMTRDPSRYDQFCRDKIAALGRYFDRHPEAMHERNEATAGIYCWAAESLLALEGPTDRCRSAVARAEALAPAYERVERLKQRAAPEPAAASPAHP